MNKHDEETQAFVNVVLWEKMEVEMACIFAYQYLQSNNRAVHMTWLHLGVPHSILYIL